jgi:very-short-patch-repair endonuclease
LDGMSHDGRPEEDHRRSAYLTSLGLRVFRVTNDDVLKSRDAVAGTILRVLNECGHPKPNPHPGPLPQGEGVNQSPLPEGEG